MKLELAQSLNIRCLKASFCYILIVMEKVCQIKLNAQDRIHNFDEVVLNYEESEAIKEAKRCLGCINKPCVEACPIHNNIPEFIKCIKNSDFDGAHKIISDNAPLASICSRVCPHKKQCEGKCTRGIKGEPICIGGLERFVSDKYLDEKLSSKPKNDHSIAIIGSGPAGLACAKSLLLDGYNVTIYEQAKQLGGVLRYGIPSFRLPKDILDKEIKKILDLGVIVKTDNKITNINELKKEYEAIFIATGTPVAKKMNIEGEDLENVYNSSDYLYLLKDYIDNNISLKGLNIGIIGGGNVAIDVARSIIRLGGKANIIYRRSFEQMPANKQELTEAKQEGVEFTILTKPLKMLPSTKDPNKLAGIHCIKTKLSELDETGRCSIVDVENSEHDIYLDIAVLAISNTTDNLILKDFELNKNNNLIIDDKGMTSINNIYAGGDVVTGPATVVSAVKAGKLAAQSIKNALK